VTSHSASRGIGVIAPGVVGRLGRASQSTLPLTPSRRREDRLLVVAGVVVRDFGWVWFGESGLIFGLDLFWLVES